MWLGCGLESDGLVGVEGVGGMCGLEIYVRGRILDRIWQLLMIDVRSRSGR